MPSQHFINLYTQDLKPKKETFTLNLSATIVLVCGLLMAFWWNQTQGAINKAEARSGSNQNLIDQLNQQIQQSQLALSKRKVNKTLEQNKGKLLTKIAEQKSVIRYLQNKHHTQLILYSSVMTDLATFHHPSVWLTHLSFDEAQKMMLSGYSTESSAIPTWLGSLKQSKHFEGQGFANLVIEKEEQGPSKFSASTDFSNGGSRDDSVATGQGAE